MNKTKNSYKLPAINQYLQNAYDNNWLSVRDPFDIYNESKVLKCDGIVLSKVCGDNFANTQYCSNIPLLDSYKCLALGNEFTGGKCILNGPNPTC